MDSSTPANKQVAKLVEQAVETLVAGKVDRASARCDLRLALRNQGCWDLSSNDDWLNDVLDLNSSLRSIWRQYEEGLHSAILDQWPAQELKGYGPPEALRDWTALWRSAGGTIFGDRMIALKDDPVWYTISDFGFPFPPYATGSKMRVRDVDRDSAMKLGLIDRDRRVSLKHISRPELVLLDLARYEEV
jgi:hypothetical protein